MYQNILLLPQISSIIATNRRCGLKVGPVLSVLCMVIAAIMSVLVFYEVGINNSPVNLTLGNWVDLGPLLIEWSLLYDAQTVSMYLPIVIISSLIQLYSQEYMGEDPHKSRFFSYLSLFAFAMLILVTGENLLIILVGWEVVGIVSYLLVNFYYTRISANHASLAALFINKLGDWGFIMALVLANAIFSDLSQATIFSLGCYINGDILFLFTICILIASMAKSALIGMHTWQPKAMEGPTSVSAQLHSSTMVTAGVFLLMRISPVLEFSSSTLMIVVWLGSLGALFGAAVGLVATDLKAIIAFSTMSQLGYMIVAIGVSQYYVALFHLITHAFFKSQLFLASGAILHSVLDNQDIRKMGGLIIHLPFTYLVFLFGSLSLMAFPFTSGFYSKDFLLEILLVPLNFTNSIAYIFTLLAALLTSIYSTRTMMITMLNRPLFPKSILLFVKDSGWLMTLPLLILSFAALTIGYFTQEIFQSFGSSFYFNSLFIHPNNIRILDASNAGSSLSQIPLFFLLFMFTIFIIKSPVYISNIKNANTNLNSSNINDVMTLKVSSYFNNAPSLINTNENIKMHKFTYNLFWLNLFNNFNNNIIIKYFVISNIMYRFIDKGILEVIGPLGLSRLFEFLGFRIDKLSTRNIIQYSIILIQIILFFLLIRIYVYL